MERMKIEITTEANELFLSALKVSIEASVSYFGTWLVHATLCSSAILLHSREKALDSNDRCHVVKLLEIRCPPAQDDLC